MTDREVELKLREMSLQNDQWHKDFEKREKHRTRQTLFWTLTIVLTIIFITVIATIGILRFLK